MTIHVSASLKEPGPITLDFSQTFGDFGVRRKLEIFLITPGEFYGWIIYHLEDIYENVTSYDNHLLGLHNKV